MEITLSKTRLSREAFKKRTPREGGDTFGSRWPSYQVIAVDSRDAFFSAATRGEAYREKERWRLSLMYLCEELRADADGFPREWFYEAWWEFQAVRRIIGTSDCRPEISTEAQHYLKDKKDEISTGIEEELKRSGLLDLLRSPGSRTAPSI